MTYLEGPAPASGGVSEARLLFVLALLVCAGCLGGDDAASEASEPTDDASDGNAGERLTAPEWSIGDRWTWSSPQVGEVTYVVTGETDGNWIVDTTNEEVAFFDARFPVSTLGEIRQSDKAGSQPEGRVEFFDWPLQANKTWTTTWDGVERAITVEAIEGSTAELVARQEGRVAVEYTYDAERATFGELVYLDENGTESFVMEPEPTASEDEPVRWQLTNAVDEAGTFGAEPTTSGFGFTVPENATDLWLDFTLACPSGSYDLSFGPSGDAQTDEGSSYENVGTCPAEANVTGPVVEEPSPGEYRGGFTGSSPEADASYDILLYVRTLQEVAIGEG